MLRRKMPRARFRVLGGPIVPLAAAAISLWLLSGVNRDQAAAGAVALLAGLALYLVFGRRPPRANPA